MVAFVLFIVLVIVVYIVITAMDARLKTERAPRIEMFTCDRHGTMPAKYAVPFDGMGALETPVLQCPMCLEDRFREARKNFGVKEKS